MKRKRKDLLTVEQITSAFWYYCFYALLGLLFDSTLVWEFAFYIYIPCLASVSWLDSGYSFYPQTPNFACYALYLVCVILIVTLSSFFIYLSACLNCGAFSFNLKKYIYLLNFTVLFYSFIASDLVFDENNKLPQIMFFMIFTFLYYQNSNLQRL